MKAINFVAASLVVILLVSCSPTSSDEYTKHYEEGLKYYETGEFDKAILSLSTAIDLEPENTAAYLLRGKSYRSIYEYEKAFQDTDKVLELDPNHYDAHVLRGLLLFDSKRYEDAIREYTTALELSKESKEALYLRAFAYSDSGEYELAIDDFQQYLIFVPNTPNRARIEGMIESLKTKSVE